MELNKSPDLVERTAVRNIEDRPFFVTLRRGETMEQGCLRCHITPEAAPTDLVAYYGPDRSFHRSEGEIVSAISIRIPLAAAYAGVNEIIKKLSALFGLTLLIVYGLSIYLSRNLIFAPLNKIRIKAMEVSNNHQYLGEQIDSPSSRELADLTEAFNYMSLNLRQERDALESKVRERTKEVNNVNFQTTLPSQSTWTRSRRSCIPYFVDLSPVCPMT